MFYYIHSHDCEYCIQVTDKLIELLMEDGHEIIRLSQDSLEHKQLLNKNSFLPNLTPLFFNSESKHYLRGATYATYYNLKKLHGGGEVVDYKKMMYYGENLKSLNLKMSTEPKTVKISDLDNDTEDKSSDKVPYKETDGAPIEKTTVGMARELAQTAFNMIRDKSQGQAILTDPEKAKRRWEICQECPQLQKRLNRCRACGCFMKVKVHLDNVKCPIDKW